MERERARLKQLIESRVFRGARSKGKREGKGVLHVNVRKGITWPPFREGPVWDPEYRRLNLTRGPRQDGRVRRCMVGSEDRVEERD
jgi:hypothetical protein